MRWLVLPLLLVACGGTKPEPEEPKPAPPAPAAEPDSLALHGALVDTHKKAVEACFGGFGKGAPYAGTFTIAGGGVSEAAVEALSDGHGPLPADCIAKHFRAMEVPAGTADGALAVRFAVENPDCDLPACKEKDLPCTFKRDIACTVVIDP